MKLLKTRIRPILLMLALVWLVEVVNILFEHGFTSWGILLLSLTGLVGIHLTPFIHANFWHALSNTIPFLVLGGLTLTIGARRF